ncbi:MAG: hypothetical protein FWD78_05510 [Treponema sp.]|nr:hypothetical protein [Treponema sp.]
MGRLSIFLLVLYLAAMPLFAAEQKSPDLDPVKNKQPLFTWEMLWTGSWYKSFNTKDSKPAADLLLNGGTLINRAEFIAGMPGPGLNLRLQGIDKIKPPVMESNLFNPGFGLYYGGKGFLWNFPGESRLLYGVLDDYGLPARIKNIWAKSPPYAELRKPTVSDLKTDPSSNENQLFLYLGLPGPASFKGFAAVQADPNFNPALNCGLEYRPDKNFCALLEGFCTQKELRARTSSAWFSASPPLPARDFRLFALGTAVSAGYWGIAADLAVSQTFAYGRDFYLNAGLRGGAKPWKVSFAMDAAGSRYVGRDGSAVGEGLRIAGRFERTWIRSGLFRLDASVRSYTLEPSFSSGSIQFYFRPSAPAGKSAPLFRISRVSLTAARNASVPQKADDSFDADIGFNLAALRMSASADLNYKSALGNAPNLVLTPPFFNKFDSVKFSLEASYGYKVFSFNIKTGYTARFEKSGLWDFSAYSSINVKNIGRISLKIASTELPDKWNYTISWRLGRFLF